MSEVILPYRHLRGVSTQTNATSRVLLPHRPHRGVTTRPNVTTRAASVRLAKEKKNENAISHGLSKLHLDPEEILRQLGPDPQAEVLPEKPGEFVRFTKLPTEIRMIIWQYYSPVLSSGRVVEVFHCLGRRRWGRGFRLDGTSSFKTNAQPPLMLNICQETRAEAFKQSLCSLGDDPKTRIMLNPISDAVYFRFHWAAEYLGHDKIRHLILDFDVLPEFLARFVHLEVFTFILHELGFTGKGLCKKLYSQYKAYEEVVPPVVFCKPSVQNRSIYEFQAQQRRMDDYKVKNPLWEMPVLNVMQTLVQDKPCCDLTEFATDIYRGQELVQLQNSSFWDGHFYFIQYSQAYGPNRLLP